MTRTRIEPYLVLAVTCTLAWLFKSHCGGGWTGSLQYLTGCYSDVVPFWGGRGVAAGDIPYLEARLEYPVLTGLLIWIEGGIARALAGPDATAVAFLNVATFVNALLAFAVLWMLERLGVGRARLFAWSAAPAVVLYLGHNWDMLAIALAVAAYLAFSKARVRAATALAALGAAAKLFPVVMLPVLGMNALIGGGTAGERVVRAARLVAIALLAWGAVNLPIALIAPDGWLEFYGFSSQRSGTAGATFDLLVHAGIWTSDIPTRNKASALAFVVGAGAILALGWRRNAARPQVLFVPVLACFMLTSKVWSPQFDLWLLPFLLIACASPVAIAVFAAADVAAYFAEFWMFAQMDGVPTGATQDHVMWAAVVRGLAMLWIITDVTRGSVPKEGRTADTAD